MADGFSMWAGEFQIRWVPPGLAYGEPSLVAELDRRCRRGGVVAITPTGPFEEASMSAPLVVARLLQAMFLDLGFSMDEIDVSGTFPTAPALPEGAIG